MLKDNPELQHPFIAIEPNGTIHGYDSETFFNNLKRMHMRQGVSGWQYGRSSQVESLMKNTAVGVNIKNAELIGKAAKLEKELAEKERRIAELEEKAKKK